MIFETETEFGTNATCITQRYHILTSPTRELVHVSRDVIDSGCQRNNPIRILIPEHQKMAKNFSLTILTFSTQATYTIFLSDNVVRALIGTYELFGKSTSSVASVRGRRK